MTLGFLLYGSGLLGVNETSSRKCKHHENIDDAQEPSRAKMRGMHSSAASVMCSRLTEFTAYSESLFAKLQEQNTQLS